MSAAMHTVTANPRTETGKGAARRLRTSGQIPAVAYGKGLAAKTLSVAPKDILTVLKSERGQNTVLQMKVNGGGDLLCMIKEYTYHPVTRSLEHVDFVEVKLDRAVDVEVPLFTTGKAVGVAKGGLLRQVYRTLPVRCLPDRIPLKLETDVHAPRARRRHRDEGREAPRGRRDSAPGRADARCRRRAGEGSHRGSGGSCSGRGSCGWRCGCSGGCCRWQGARGGRCCGG